MTLTKSAVTVFAPTDANGDPRGANIGETQTWGLEVEAAISALATYTGASVIRATLSDLNTHSGSSAGDIGIVVFDGDNNGRYRWSGSAWVYLGPLPADAAQTSASAAAASATDAANHDASASAHDTASAQSATAAQTAATIAVAAKSDAQLADAHATASAQSAATHDASAGAAASAAEVSHQAAVSAAAATGQVAIFATKAAAVAALGSLTSGSWVEIEADESTTGGRYRYLVSGGALTNPIDMLAGVLPVWQALGLPTPPVPMISKWQFLTQLNADGNLSAFMAELDGDPTSAEAIEYASAAFVTKTSALAVRAFAGRYTSPSAQLAFFAAAGGQKLGITAWPYVAQWQWRKQLAADGNLMTVLNDPSFDGSPTSATGIELASATHVSQSTALGLATFATGLYPTDADKAAFWVACLAQTL